MESLIDDSVLLRKLEFDAATTNDDILTDQEKNRARILIADTERLLSSLDKETLGPLGYQEVKRRLAKFQIALAPHKCLAPETLGHIFVCTLDWDSSKFPPDFSKPPWVLRRVCSRWRCIALNERRLWNTAIIGTDGTRPSLTPLSKLASIIHSVIPPPGPLSISLIYTNRASAVEAIETLIIPNLPRLTKLNVYIDASGFSRLFNVPNDSFGSMESMSWHLWCRGDGSQFTQPFSSAIAFHHAVNLRNLEIRFEGPTPLSNAVISIPIPWCQLTSLVLEEIRTLALPDIHCILRKCSSLQKLQVALNSSDRMAADLEISESMNLPDLRYVELRGSHNHPNIITSLGLPWGQLTILRLKDFFNRASTSETYDILQKCVHVEELSVLMGHKHHSPKSTVEVLVLPRLKNLHLDLEKSNILDQLIAPALASITIDSVLPIPSTQISDMIVRSRCSLSTLTYIGKKCDDYPAFYFLLDLIPSLRKLRVQDLVLDLTTIQCMTSGELLPQLTSLTCRLEATALTSFVEFLETRVMGEKRTGSRIPVLRRARCYVKHAKTSLDLIDATDRGVERLNTEYGTDFAVLQRLDEQFELWFQTGSTRRGVKGNNGI